MKSKLPDNVSRTHREIVKLIKDLYPYHDLYVEYPLQKLYDLHKRREGYKTKDILHNKDRIKAARLSLDIYDATSNIVIEIQGEQHYRHVEFFHKKKSDFKRQLLRDKFKKHICSLFKVNFIEIPTGTKVTETLLKGIYESQ